MRRKNITSRDDGVSLMIGVDTAVFHGFVDAAQRVRLPASAMCCRKKSFTFAISRRQPPWAMSMRASAHRNWNRRLPSCPLSMRDRIWSSTSKHDGAEGDKEYTLHFNETDALSESQRGYVETQFRLFNTWYAEWSKLPGAVQRCKALSSNALCKKALPLRRAFCFGFYHETASRPFSASLVEMVDLRLVERDAFALRGGAGGKATLRGQARALPHNRLEEGFRAGERIARAASLRLRAKRR